MPRMFENLFIENLFNDDTKIYYISAVSTLIISITLHELAHGWAALWQGDQTPRLMGRMNPNPFIHMGPLSIGLIFFVGIGWGMMPVDPSRFRSRYGDAIVAAAGPAMNLLLGILAAIGLALWYHFDTIHTEGPHANFQQFLWVFSYFNFGLMIFNLGPVFPLDGSHILGNFSPRYRQWMNNLSNPMVPFMVYFFLIYVLMNQGYGIWTLGARMSDGIILGILSLLSG